MRSEIEESQLERLNQRGRLLKRGGILRSALTTKQTLELAYHDPSPALAEEQESRQTEPGRRGARCRARPMTVVEQLVNAICGQQQGS